MRTTERITVTLPADLLAQVARLEKNRSHFVATAVAHEVARRHRLEFARSLASPHTESVEGAKEDLQAWGEAAAPGDADLVDLSRGTAVRWHPELGWVAVPP